MGYKVLYRKYRPDTFEEIIGQNFIVDTLRNSVENNNFSHAIYLQVLEELVNLIFIKKFHQILF